MGIKDTDWQKWGAAVAVLMVVVLAYALLRVKLELSPDRITTCPNVPIEVDVKWRAPGHRMVKVFAYQIGAAPMLMTTGGWRGHAKTEAWVGDGTTLMITDSHDRPLARKTVESIACPG